MVSWERVRWEVRNVGAALLSSVSERRVKPSVTVMEINVSFGCGYISLPSCLAFVMKTGTAISSGSIQEKKVVVVLEGWVSCVFCLFVCLFVCFSLLLFYKPDDVYCQSWVNRFCVFCLFVFLSFFTNQMTFIANGQDVC